LELHSSSKPTVYRNNCTGCRICEKYCAHNAILVGKDKIAAIDEDMCVGCGQCIALCQYDAAMTSDWGTTELLNRKIAEYTKAVLYDKPNFHINFIMNVSPNCDCWDHNDAAIVPDIGIAASFDPVALDRACADLVTKAPALPNSYLTDKHPDGKHFEDEDKFPLIHPDARWQAGLSHAEKIGIGTERYELIEC